MNDTRNANRDASLGSESKAHLEIDKLVAERDKLRNDNKPWNRHAAAFVSLAAVVVSAAQIWTALVRNDEERARSENDRRVRCVEVGLKVAEFANSSRTKFNTMEPGEQVGFLNVVLAAFPPVEAHGVLRATTPGATDPLVLSHLRDALSKLEDAEAARPCLTRDLVYEAPTPGGRPLPNDLPAPTLLPPTGLSCPTVSEVSGPPLAIFPQIVGGEDRDAARRILDRVRARASDFTRMPIEDVRARDPAAQGAEVRYYFRDQESQAKHLAELLKRGACEEGFDQAFGEVRTVYIGNRFSNLPRGRIEVWFPRLSSSVSAR